MVDMIWPKHTALQAVIGLEHASSIQNGRWGSWVAMVFTNLAFATRGVDNSAVLGEY